MGRKTYDRDILRHVQSMKQEATNYLMFALLASVCAWRYWGGHITTSGNAGLAGRAGHARLYPIQQLFLISNLHSASEISPGLPVGHSARGTEFHSSIPFDATRPFLKRATSFFRGSPLATINSRSIAISA